MRAPLVVAGSLVALLSAAVPAGASYAGRNGLIAFEGSSGYKDGTVAIRTMGPHGEGGPKGRKISPAGDKNSGTSSRNPGWSRGGKRIAYETDTFAGHASIYIARPDGSDRRRLPVDIDATEPAWSPGGRYLAFVERIPDEEIGVAEFRIYTVRTDGTELRRIALGTDPEWSPDGRWIMFDPEDGCPALMRPDGSMRRRVLPKPVSGIECAHSPDFSPDGKRIVFISSNKESSGPDVYTVKRNGKDLRRLTRTRDPGVDRSEKTRKKANEYNPVWSPDGRRILYFRDGPAESNSGAYVMNTDGSNPRRLNSAGLLYAWQGRAR